MKATALLQYKTSKAAVQAKATTNPLQLRTEVEEVPLQTKQNPLREIRYNQNPLWKKQSNQNPLQLLSEKYTQPDGKNPLQLQAQPATTQQPEQKNKTGLPDKLKAGIEALSGYSMDAVRVHYNSDKPKQLQALAYAKGTDIHIAPGQEKHLTHEAWHVVQQMQGRVQPTMQMKGEVAVNDDKGLENEADRMGKKAMNCLTPIMNSGSVMSQPQPVVQAVKNENGEESKGAATANKKKKRKKKKTTESKQEQPSNEVQSEQESFNESIEEIKQNEQESPIESIEGIKQNAQTSLYERIDEINEIFPKVQASGTEAPSNDLNKVIKKVEKIKELTGTLLPQITDITILNAKVEALNVGLNRVETDPAFLKAKDLHRQKNIKEEYFKAVEVNAKIVRREIEKKLDGKGDPYGKVDVINEKKDIYTIMNYDRRRYHNDVLREVLKVYPQSEDNAKPYYNWVVKQGYFSNFTKKPKKDTNLKADINVHFL
jgi:hypothetical protein